MNRRRPLSKTPTPARPTGDAPNLLADLRMLIEQAWQAASAAVNASLGLMFWRIGIRTRNEVLTGQRAAYGGEIVVTLSRQWVADCGRGFEEKNLRRMVQFAEIYPDEEIVVSLIRQFRRASMSPNT